MIEDDIGSDSMISKVLESRRNIVIYIVLASSSTLIKLTSILTYLIMQ